MKKTIKKLLLIALILLPWATSAQGSLTVCDGTATNEYVPFYGYYADEAQNGQMIYPADSLTGMINTEITEMVFYVSSFGSWGSDLGDWIVSMGITNENTLSGIDNTVTLSEVYSGPLSFNSDNTLMTVTFTNGFVYTGGNLLVQFNHPITSGWRQISFYGVNATGASYCYNGQRNFLPKVSFSYENTSCLSPTALTVTPGENEIEFSWTPRSSANQYIVYLNGMVADNNVTDTFYTFTDLTSNTPYTVGVQGICQGNDNSSIATTSTRTTCGAITLPFSDDFDSYPNGQWPPCWHRLKKHNTDPSVNNVYQASGTQSIFLLAQNDTNLFVAPSAIPTTGDNIYVRFKAFCDYSFYFSPSPWWIKAGVMTDTGDVSTFIMLDSIGYHNCNYAFEEHEFNTSSLDPNATYWVAWMFTSNDSYSPGAIDDVYISEIPSCLRATGATVTNVTGHTADLYWDDMGADSYTIYYGTTNNINDNDITVVSTTDTAITLTGLNSETQYFAWVASVCSGDEAEANAFGSFTTLVSCPPVTGLTVDTSYADGAIISWSSQGTESEWAVIIDSNDADYVTVPTYTVSGLSAMTGHTVQVRAICDVDDTSAASSIDFATTCEDATCNITVNMTDTYGDGWNGNSIDFYQAGILIGSATLSNGSNGTESVQVCSTAALELRFTKGSYATEMGGTVTDGAGLTIFNIENMNSHNTGDLLASVAIPCPSCLPVTGLVVSHVDSTSITYEWDVINGNSYLVAFDGGAFDENSAGSYTATGLMPNTQHSFQIMTICDVDDTSSVTTLSYRTTCVMMTLPYVETFESGNVGDMPTCWNTVIDYAYTEYSGNTTHYPSISNDGYNSMKSLTFIANGSCMAASSAIPNNGWQGDQYHISFFARLSSYASANAGVMTNVDYDSTFIPLTSITNDDQWHHYDIYTSGLNPSETYFFSILFNGTSTYYALSVDSLVIEIDGGCHYPSNVSVTTTTNSATVHWFNNGTTADFIVAYRPSNANTYTYAYAGAADSLLINNLQGATSYTFIVGNICSNGDTLWSSPASAVTDCSIINLPYFEDFAAYAEDVMPPCWVYNATGITHFDGGLFFRSNTGPGYPAVLPQFNNTISKMEIEFKTKVGPVSQGDAILVGVADANGNFMQWLDTLTDPNQSRSAFVWMTYRFDTYTGNGQRIALGRLYTGSDWALIDDITVRMIPTCSPAENIVGHNLYDPDSSYFTWTNPDMITAFQVYVDTITADTTTIPVNTLTTITGYDYLIPSGILTGGGKYKFFIRANCGNGFSPWNVVSFGSGEYIMSQSGTDTVTSCGLVIYDNGGPIAGYYSQTSSALVVYPAGTGNRLQIYGAYLSLYNDGASTLTIYDGAGTSGSILYQTSYSGPTTMYDSIVSLPLATSTTGPLTVSFNAGTYVNPGYELYVRCIPVVSCDQPSYIQANSITDNSATLSWYGNANNYNIYYRPFGSSSWNMTTSTTASTTLTGLAAATTYEVQIRAICSAVDSSDISSVFSFTTECSIVNITPSFSLIEEFEGIQVPSSCWQLVYGSSSNATDNPVVFDAAAAHSGSKGLRFSSANATASGNYHQTLITPELHCDSSMSVLFYVRASQGNESFRVGYSSTGSSTADFSWQPTVTAGASWTLFRTDIPASVKYFAINYFAGSPHHHLYVDSLVVAINDGTIECPAPVIVSTSATATSITVNYNNFGPVQAGIVEGSVWNDATTPHDLAEGNTFTFDHLFSNDSPLSDTTTYTIGLRSVCGGDHSDWVTATVTTLQMVCNTPTEVTASVIDGTSATIRWNANGASAWEVNYSDGTNENTVTATTTATNLTNLIAGTTYTVRVRAICGDHFSDWSSSVDFMPSDCPIPMGLSTREITSSSAKIFWDAADNDRWEIAYGPTGSFNITYATHATVTTNEYTISGLSANQNYTWTVRTICAEDEMSDWSARIDFTTRPNPEGIDNAQLSSDSYQMAIHPNPASDVVNLTFSGINDEVAITIVDINGRVVKELSLFCNQGDCTATLQVDNLPQGAYFVRATNNGELNLVKKLIVK